MWLVLALVHFWKAENTWKTSLKMCKLFSVVNSTLALLPPSFKTVYVNMLSEIAKPICNAFMLLLDTCTIPSILFNEVTCLQIWGKKSVGDPLKPWNNACLDSAATKSRSFALFHTCCHILRVSALSVTYLEMLLSQLARFAQTNQVNE